MKAKKKGWMWSMLSQADRADMLLMALGFAGCVGDGITMPLTLLITSSLMNDIGSHSYDFNSLLIPSIDRNAVLLCYVAIGSWFLCFLEGYCWTRTAGRQAAKMQVSCLRAVLRQEVAFFDLNDTTTSEIVTIVSNDTLSIQDCLSEKVPNFLMNVMSFIGSQVAAFSMLWKLAIVELPLVVLLVIPGLLYSRTLMGLARKLRDEYRIAGSIVEQAVSSIRTVYAFVGEQDTVSKFSAALEGSVKLGLKQGLAKGLAMGSSGLILAVAAFNCWYGSRLVVNGDAKGGTVFAVGAEIAVGGYALGSALSNIRYLSEGASAGERIMEIMNRVPKIDSDDPSGKIMENVKGEVEFKQVKFAYPSRPEKLVLENFSLKIQTGRRVALVGKSGCGKSTVISMLQRFYDPLGGEILLDGVRIDEIQVKWLRMQLGVVSQEPALFGTSIKENILFGKEDASMEEVIEAAKDANAHGFITQLPQGYDTEVGERGIQVSGGQKQRIAIARAIIRKPQVVILDEATSALDSESERVVQEALERASIGRTTIVIAHRLSTIRNSESIAIAVMEEGQVREMGSHEELMRTGEQGLYYALAKASTMKKHEYQVKSQIDNIDDEDADGDGDADDDEDADDDSVEIIEKQEETKEEEENDDSGGVEMIDKQEEAKKEEEEENDVSLRRLVELNSGAEWKVHGSLGCLSAVIFGAVQPVYAFVMGATIASFFSGEREEVISKTRKYIMGVVGLAMLSLAVNVIQHYSFGYMGEQLTKRVRERMLSKILTFEMGWFDREENSSGAICSRLAKDANTVRSLVGDRISLIVQTCSAIVVACTMGLVIAWKLAAVMIAVQPLIIGSYYTRRVLIKRISTKLAQESVASSRIAGEAIANIRTVTSLSSQSRIVGMMTTEIEKKSHGHAVTAGLGLAFAQGIMTCTWALDFWYGGRLVAQGHQGKKGIVVIDAKAVFETFMILVSTGKVIADAGSMTSDLAKGASAVKSVFEILDRVTRIKPEPQSQSKEDNVNVSSIIINGNVSFHNVYFAYPSRPQAMVLKDFSLEIQAGKSTALVGHSGSGKSTVISLIERFYDPIRGTVRIDDRDLKSFDDLRALRRQIAVVSQEPVLFSGTIRENILYGYGYGETREAEAVVAAAAEAANAHGFISGMPLGYETLCGERGSQLSGGQKQRVAIARAVLRNPKILLLDEATSALDGEAERAVQQAIERLMLGRTCIVVAHRINSLAGCTQIVVLGPNGRVLEKGTHSQLTGAGTRTGTYYSTLVNLHTSTSTSTCGLNNY